MEELATVVAERASAAVLIGESAPELAAIFGAAGLVTHRARVKPGGGGGAGPTRSRAKLLRHGRDAQATVLLSPAAASFDMFVDYADRGRAFKAAVASIAAHPADPARRTAASRSNPEDRAMTESMRARRAMPTAGQGPGLAKPRSRCRGRAAAAGPARNRRPRRPARRPRLVRRPPGCMPQVASSAARSASATSRTT